MENSLLISRPPELRLNQSQLKKLGRFPESRVVQQIQSENLTGYSEPVERLPTVRAVAGKLENMRLLSYAEGVNYLWVLVNAYRLIGVPPLEDDGFEAYQLVATTGETALDVFEEISSSLNREYQVAFGRELSLELVRYRHEDELQKKHAVNTERERKFLQVLQTYCAMEDFLKIELPSIEKQETHLHFVLGQLETMYGIRPAEPPAPVPHRRATDEPAWKNYETENPGFSWDNVRRSFGNDMTIRLLLRKNRFDVLMQMLREFQLEIPEKVLCNYTKAVKRNGALPDRRLPDFQELEDFIRPALASLPCEGKEEKCDPALHGCTSFHAPGSMHATASARAAGLHQSAT